STLSSFAKSLTNRNLQPMVGEKREVGPLRKRIVNSVFEINALDHDPTVGSDYLSYSGAPAYNPENWYRNGSQQGISNHQSRSHIWGDLHRYLFASSFAEEEGESPTLKDFPVSLMPAHKNAVESAKIGKFTDRFRVQVKGRPATTITSHISKDGHYFIHYDPLQCRSLTVREAARIQTFPDDYHFEGPRTEQYKQVGNAVPPFLAFQIAELVRDFFGPSEKS
ncbi:MAG: DNA cytosine methyltransferase, partial [Chloroflexi bacterium]|nr:DNA cytosine methyltransferase [Chloroflexota bacterium]